MQETALSSLLERARPEDMENLASIACQSLDNQDQARLVHNTKNEVMCCCQPRTISTNPHYQALKVLLTMVEFGGKTLRRNLLQTLVADEEEEVMDELIYEYMIRSGSINEEGVRKSCAGEEFTSCDELSEEHGGRSL